MMVRAISLVRREVFAGTYQIREASHGHHIDLRHILLDRNLHAALALGHLALAVAFTMAVGDSIGPLAGAGICLSAAAVALMLMLRAAEEPTPRAHRAPAVEHGSSRGTAGLVASGALTLDVARREVSGLLAMMSHELRTPLNAILGNADAIRHEILGPVGAPRYRESAVDILEGGQNLLRASEDMLTLTGTVAATRSNTSRVRALVRPVAGGSSDEPASASACRSNTRRASSRASGRMAKVVILEACGPRPTPCRRRTGRCGGRGSGSRCVPRSARFDPQEGSATMGPWLTLSRKMTIPSRTGCSRCSAWASWSA